MKIIRRLAISVIAAAWMGLALDASALTIGRLRGVALLGQPLEVVANVQLGEDEVAATTCMNAVVAYGGVQQPSGQTSATVTPGPQAQNLQVVIVASGRVNEPVVTVDLTAGCTQKTTRQFVLLAEVPSETVGQVQAASLSASSLTTSAAQRVVPKPGDVPGNVTKVAASPEGKTEVLSPKPSSRPQKPERPTKRVVAQNATQSLSPEAIDDLKKRIEAVADWQASKPTTQELEAQKAAVDGLQENLKALQAVTLINQKSILAVSNALEASETRRLSPKLIYGLLALLALAVLALGYLLWSVGTGAQSSAPWWGSSVAPQAPSPHVADKQDVAEAALMPAPAERSATEQTHKLPATSIPSGAKIPPSVDIELGESAFAGLAAAESPSPRDASIAEPKRTEKRDFAPSGSATLRAINTKEMFDVRQQADFFMALGQHGEAINVLERSNAESEESNPLVLLDLLKILHTLSRRAEFDRYRAEFNLLFTGIVPAYPVFLEQGNGLESYTSIVAPLIKLWPTDDAMDFLEQCMVRTPEDEPEQGFDLEAFRDLLTLHGVLRRMQADLDSTFAPFSAMRTQESASRSDADASPPTISPDIDLDLTDNNKTNLIEFDFNGIGRVDDAKG